MSATTTADIWIPVAADAAGKVIEEKELDDFFADPMGTFTTTDEWPAKLLAVRGESAPYTDKEGVRHLNALMPRGDILREVQASILPPDDVHFEWTRTKAIAAAANSDKPKLPNGPTGGY